jgi:hypothetical protein
VAPRAARRLLSALVAGRTCRTATLLAARDAAQLVVATKGGMGTVRARAAAASAASAQRSRRCVPPPRTPS